MKHMLWQQPRLVALAFAGLTVMTASAGAFSLALFTDTATVGANAFSTGTIDISTSPTTAVVSYSNMFPGDSVTDDLLVSNDGTGALRYVMTSASTNADTKALRDQLQLAVRTVDAGGGTDFGTDADYCDDGTGTSVYSGGLGSAAFGDATAGAQAGDRDLAVSGSERLCFTVSLDASTGNAYQNAATTTTFTFTAEQTKNN
jgi:hypothetical protein